MSKKNIYPLCAETFKKWSLSNEKYTNILLNLGILELFDVTLRDGLQSLTVEEQLSITTNDKLKMYNNIKFNYNVQNIEIGSIVSEKVLPVFKDTLKILQILHNYTEKTNNYILIPNKNKLGEMFNNKNFHKNKIRHLSLITSVSNSFQLKNTKMSLNDSDNDINAILDNLNYIHEDGSVTIPKIKLYVSCINECPIEGKIDNDFIVNRLLKLSKMNIDNICLSDTCGTLTPDDFEYIVETCLYFGLQSSRLSLHLHVNPERESVVEQIFFKALDYKILKFDISNLKTGGCSVTMKKEQLTPNLSYELYYKYLCRYIMKKVL
jgi:hydroxymethylglutaryl-CoA lyase